MTARRVPEAACSARTAGLGGLRAWEGKADERMRLRRGEQHDGRCMKADCEGCKGKLTMDEGSFPSPAVSAPAGPSIATAACATAAAGLARGTSVQHFSRAHTGALRLKCFISRNASATRLV
eukprot:CAMPEP_0180096320 /NCGR_PEP_ID=MMETSP0985-20121206/26624_1 /TAXON_ID=483367 /ORGANISM="non described non described, Strain CCMP 2436" /LENGTH=121 /DNA_ID=CAMNT_0022031625 /DNA_START=28 /DNA_END=394 /DNA_ORIENTATION=+